MRPGEKIQLKPLSELLGVVNEEAAMDIEMQLMMRWCRSDMSARDAEQQNKRRF